MTTQSDGTAERDAALLMLHEMTRKRSRRIAADLLEVFNGQFAFCSNPFALSSGGSEFADYFDWHLSYLLEKVRATNRLLVSPACDSVQCCFVSSSRGSVSNGERN